MTIQGRRNATFCGCQFIDDSLRPVRRGLSEASGNCCEQAARSMEFTQTSSHVHSPLRDFIVILSLPRFVSSEKLKRIGVLGAKRWPSSDPIGCLVFHHATVRTLVPETPCLLQTARVCGGTLCWSRAAHKQIRAVLDFWPRAKELILSGACWRK